MSDNTETVESNVAAPKRRGVPVWALIIIGLIAIAVGFFVAMMISSISGKKAEANLPTYVPVVQINDTNQYDPSAWGQNFPNEYAGWQGTSQFKTSMHLTAANKLSLDDPEAIVNPAGLNASDKAVNPAPVAVAPSTTDVIARDWVTPEKIIQDPRLVTMWNGYAFAIDYRHLRGHAYMLTDQRDTLRVTAPPKAQPGACMNCHVSMPGVLSILGNGTTDKPVPITNYAPGDPNMNAAFKALNTMKYLAPDPSDDTKVTISKTDPNGPTGLYGYVKAAGMDQPIGCVDCHDPATMNLRVTRPAFINGMAAMKAAQGVANYDVNKDATTQEMRTFVCAQCHVEYYFAPAAPAGTTAPDNALPANTLVFPWANGGNDIDSIFAYYTDPTNFPATGKPFTDFTNALTGANVLKAQHPEFEAWSQGVHAANGVTCADCHMPYQRVGNQKVSNHDVESPMNDINGTCGTCHTASEQSLRDQVTTIQARYTASRDQAMDALTQFINAIAAAKASGTVPQSQIDAALTYQNKASFYADYGYSENSYGFHAPDYFQRIFMESIDASRQGQLVLQGVDPATLAPSDVTVANQEKASK
ncbi:MAG: ammonia-forming cytochrome c nitrite reductase subunit c552 [Propionibacteriaceae bacterium]|nr:ammonia-forming cytochrome c nitrite reductase subunit c552 [Propionibacteriaceae bacterium]